MLQPHHLMNARVVNILRGDMSVETKTTLIEYLPLYDENKSITMLGPDCLDLLR